MPSVGDLNYYSINYLFSEAGQLFFNYGTEGYSFEYDANGKPLYTDLIRNNPDYSEMIAKYKFASNVATEYLPSVMDATVGYYCFGDAQWAILDQFRDCETDGSYNIPTAVTLNTGAAAIAIVELLSAGFQHVTMCDRKGTIYQGREGLSWLEEEIAEITNREKMAGSLADMLVGADIFIGVSGSGSVTTAMVRTMTKDAIVFACANPTPEICPDDAKAGGAAVVATGRSDFPNQINNVLAFPGIFRGAFDVRASDINEEMKMAAAKALAGLISPEELSADLYHPLRF